MPANCNSMLCLLTATTYTTVRSWWSYTHALVYMHHREVVVAVYTCSGVYAPPYSRGGRRHMPWSYSHAVVVFTCSGRIHMQLSYSHAVVVLEIVFFFSSHILNKYPQKKLYTLRVRIQGVSCRPYPRQLASL